MVAPLVGAAVGAGVNLLGSLLGELWANADDEERKALEAKVTDAYGNISLPALEALMGQVEGGSAFGQAPTDFGNKGLRDAALRRMTEEGLSGGNTLEQQLAMSEAQRAAGAATRRGQESALASAAGRGMGGASSTLQAQLLGASHGADRAAQVGLQGAMSARQRALEALAQGGGMAGQAEQADAAADARRREAMDSIARFNAEQSARAAQQNYQNQMALAQVRAGSAAYGAESAERRAQRKRGVAGGLGQAGGYLGTAWGQGGKP